MLNLILTFLVAVGFYLYLYIRHVHISDELYVLILLGAVALYWFLDTVSPLFVSSRRRTELFEKEFGYLIGKKVNLDYRVWLVKGGSICGCDREVLLEDVQTHQKRLVPVGYLVCNISDGRVAVVDETENGNLDNTISNLTDEQKQRLKESNDLYDKYYEEALRKYSKTNCPKCHSDKVIADKNGFSTGQAIFGGALLGVPGLLAGFLGSNKLFFVCMNCGHRYLPRKY
jgi:DNA-directed RNA polymerase subunit M/transcription elongation factor TFIIS